MSAALERALPLWGMNNAAWHLVATRENHVYRVEHPKGVFAVRLHRQGYRNDAELRSELEWMAALAKGGLHLPRPVRSETGQFLHVVDGVQIDVLNWLKGAPIGQTGTPLDTPDRVGLFQRLGVEMAQLHAISDNWTLPAGFERWAWDRDGLIGKTPLWGRFWENPTLSNDERMLFQRARDLANDQLRAKDGTLDYGLIHADLVRENVMTDGDTLQFIDFDDGGFGYRLFDIATTLIKNMDEPDFPTLKAALIQGYRTVRSINTDALDLFLLLRAFTYVGWIVPRINEDGGAARNRRFVARALQMTRAFLD